jgi:glucosyl-3-phosphoglycerate synthase
MTQGLPELVAAKRDAGLTVSVCIPARNEAATIGPIVDTIRRELMEAHPLVDELIVVDDGSTDATAEIAAAAGARVVPEASILPGQPPGSGKGNVLWKSLHASQGDIVCWVDGDITNFEAHFVSRLVAPLIESDAIVFAKGFYQRPLHDEPHGGGRVTELMARPVLSLLFPKVADMIQPLSGEYAGRRHALEALPFAQGWGVEIGLLIDLVERFGRDSLAQVDLGVRHHRNKALDRLGASALAILVAALRRSGSGELPHDVATSGVAGLLRFGDGHEPEQVAVEVRERPPLTSVAEYLDAHPR